MNTKEVQRVGKLAAFINSEGYYYIHDDGIGFKAGDESRVAILEVGDITGDPIKLDTKEFNKMLTGIKGEELELEVIDDRGLRKLKLTSGRNRRQIPILTMSDNETVPKMPPLEKYHSVKATVNSVELKALDAFGSIIVTKPDVIKVQDGEDDHFGSAELLIESEGEGDCMFSVDFISKFLGCIGDVDVEVQWGKASPIEFNVDEVRFVLAPRVATE